VLAAQSSDGALAISGSDAGLPPGPGKSARRDDGCSRSSKEGSTLATATATSSKLKPLGDRVVIKPTPREEMTKSGIVLPDTAKEKPQEGEIIAVGPGRTLDDGKREAMDVQVGQKVLYAKYAGTEFKLDDDELLIVSQKDILAVVGE
jgi:chaperonin GroES